MSESSEFAREIHARLRRPVRDEIRVLGLLIRTDEGAVGVLRVARTSLQPYLPANLLAELVAVEGLVPVAWTTLRATLDALHTLDRIGRGIMAVSRTVARGTAGEIAGFAGGLILIGAVVDALARRGAELAGVMASIWSGGLAPAAMAPVGETTEQGAASATDAEPQRGA